MTSEERMLIAEALRQRIIEITKLFQEPGAHVPQPEIPRAMKVQIAVLARDLDREFCKTRPGIRASFCGNRSRRNESKR
jgi:hypothetical protein